MNKITLVKEHKHWRHIYTEAANFIKATLGKNCLEVHHIGSTAVADLSAKPIVDILAVVTNISDIDKTPSPLEEQGFIAHGEYGIPFRRYFSNNSIHLHIYPQGNAEIERHLLFRDYLNHHAIDKNRYEALKIKLSKIHVDNTKGYAIDKNKFIKSIEKKAKFNGKRLRFPLADDEWETYHELKKTLIFDDIPGITYDPHFPEIHKPNHIHFIYYQGQNITTCAHVEFWQPKMAILRAIATSPQYQRKGLAGSCLKQVEHWLTLHNIKELYAHANNKAYPFYQRMGYKKKSFNDISIHASKTTDVCKQL